MDEVLWLPAPGRRLQELVPDPGGGRTGGDVEVEQFPPLVTDEEEDVEGPEGHGLDDKQVGGPDAAQLIRQESSPALAPHRPRLPPSVPPEGAVAHHAAQLQQLAPDALGPPEGILLRDPGDERPQLGAEMGTTEAGSRLPPPVQSPALPMPSQDGIGLHQTEVLLPTFRPDAAKPYPQDSIGSPEAGMWVGV